MGVVSTRQWHVFKMCSSAAGGLILRSAVDGSGGFDARARLRLNKEINILFQLLFPRQAPGHGNWKRRRAPRRTRGRGQRSRPNSCRDWKTSSRRTATSRSSGDSLWPRNSTWTSLRSKSGSRTSGPRSKKPAATRTHWPCSWWLRDSTTIRPPPCRTRRTRASSRTQLELKLNWKWMKGRGGTI